MQISEGEFKTKITSWRQQFSEMVDTLDHANPQFYYGVYVVVITLLTYPVSAYTAERSFSCMKRLKTPLRRTMREGRLSS